MGEYLLEGRREPVNAMDFHLMLAQAVEDGREATI